MLTGEHGVGVEKRDLMPAMFSETDLDQQQRLKCAFDAKGLLNPGKVFPTLHRCAELGRMHVHAGQRGVPGHSAVLSLVTDILKPRDATDVEAAVALGAGRRQDARDRRPRLEARHRPRRRRWDLTLDLSGLSGVTLYEPEELVLSAKAGTPLAEIEALLAASNQELAFEPMDYGPLLGGAAGHGTIGGVLAANLSGPRRIKAGAARDHFLGFTAVSGRGETFKSGGRVVKNVTGYDLCKLMAGSWGTLGAMTEVTVKVLPRAETEETLLVLGLDDAKAAQAMSAAMDRPATSPARRICRRRVALRVDRRGQRRSRRCGSKASRRRSRIASIRSRRCSSRSARSRRSTRRPRARSGAAVRDVTPFAAATTARRCGASRPRRRAGTRSPAAIAPAARACSTTGPAG